MSISIKYKDNIVVTADSGDTITIHCTNKKFNEDLVIESSASGSSDTDSPLPIEVATETEMTELLESAEVGSVYKYTGTTTENYENGGLYIIEASLITFTVEGTTYQAQAGMTWGEFMQSDYNTAGFATSTGNYEDTESVMTPGYTGYVSTDDTESGKVNCGTEIINGFTYYELTFDEM